MIAIARPADPMATETSFGKIDSAPTSIMLLSSAVHRDQSRSYRRYLDPWKANAKENSLSLILFHFVLKLVIKVPVLSAVVRLRPQRCVPFSENTRYRKREVLP